MARSSSRRLALWAILLASPLLISAEDGDYGLKMITKAGKGVCYIEKLKKLPPIDKQDVNWGTCDSNMEYPENEYKNSKKRQEDHFRKHKVNPEDEPYKTQINDAVTKQIQKYLRQRLAKLPAAYLAACDSYIEDQIKAPSQEYSSLLGDSAEYTWRGVAHCLLQTMESQIGAQGVSDLTERWTSPKPFHQSIIDRENENRARHGSPALTIDSELNTRAQRYAETLAKMCKMEHMSKEHPDRTYNGGLTGENIGEAAALQGTDADNGMDIANEWYTEINNYPWPQFTGDNTKGVIGHFTQSVWKSSQLAGYGIARNPSCGKAIIVARYSPGGNIQSPGMPYYKENVLPLK